MASTRTSSTSQSTQTPPRTKHQAADKPKPQYVYVVSVDKIDRASDPSPTIHGIYEDIKDANNAVKRIVNDEYSGVTDYDRGVHPDGTAYWSSDDTREGERIDVRVEKMRVRPPGSEKECDWEDPEEDDDE
ncbi:uncharacterized protein PAC_09535 [Phialocephala subalpina]|uniref:Uncharacterized protein n=1 Tax=Phialocephala subalpina TaxID=576137 RepID=A0A1L7X3Q0_9HELO|nr:uncharacterized protein PAC_09535 [Phialocephala subalpina]